ncbi:hypothetical protein ACJW31_03G069200 [Castanea mollissima]
MISRHNAIRGFKLYRDNAYTIGTLMVDAFATLYLEKSHLNNTQQGIGDVEKSENQHEVKDVNEDGEHEGPYTIKATAGEDDEGASLRSIVNNSCVTPNLLNKSLRQTYMRLFLAQKPNLFVWIWN